jgi:RNA polymerase sigma-70 factor (ECF subfamily)
MTHLEFAHSYNQMQTLLYAFACRLTKNESDAQDLLQDTAYKAFKYKNLYQPKTNLRAWLMTIMRNTFINNYRQKKRRNVQNDTTDNEYFVNSGHLTVVNGGEMSTSLEEIWSVVDELEDWLKVPFLLFYQGYKYDEIAELLDIPVGTVKSRIFFARKKMQGTLKERYEVPAYEEMAA